MCRLLRSLTLPFGFLLGLLALALTGQAQTDASKYPNTPDILREHKFGQLDQRLPTANTYRTASGAPGHQYWQNRADYDIRVELDEPGHRIIGSETITYTNNSPDALGYLWLQLDQNNLAKDGDALTTRTGGLPGSISFAQLERSQYAESFDGGYKLTRVALADGRALPYTVNKTMMRVDLPTPLLPGKTLSFRIDFSYAINNVKLLGARAGYEPFGDGNDIFQICHWFPRMAVYADNQGWQHKQFLGTGEFTLPFGDYKVSITVPADHVVTATGDLLNPTAVLTATQQQRWAKARTETKTPVLIVTPDEAKQAEKSKATAKKTWTWAAKNVRDFAWSSSRKFIWDAMAVNVAGRTIMAQSLYPNEGNPLWEKYSTHSVAHTLRVYSKHTIDYPYPSAISVNCDFGFGGMEYPMICFNAPRPLADGTYSDRTKYGLIGVIIHEVGHNFFPMIINSDERQWAWMDEGLNTFMQGLTELEWDRNWPARRINARDIVGYMRADASVQNPIMTNSESIIRYGDNAYAKPAIALNILRETVMGRELFDHAFKEYSRRWAFKSPAPADFFRTMEDASGMDLDWFWRGWFYTTERVDVGIEGVRYVKLDTRDPETELAARRAQYAAVPPSITTVRNAGTPGLVDLQPELKDFYNSYDSLAVQPWNKAAYEQYWKGLSEDERKLLQAQKGVHYYQIDLKNIGGLVMPVILEFEFEDGTKEMKRIPVEVWRYNTERISKVFNFAKPVKQIVLDPHQETADTDLSNNAFPPRQAPSRFQLFKQNFQPAPNPMQLDRRFNGEKPAGSGSN